MNKKTDGTATSFIRVFIRRNREDPMRANPHWHDCFEILYVLQGQARYIAEEKACDI